MSTASADPVVSVFVISDFAVGEDRYGPFAARIQMESFRRAGRAMR